MPALTGFSTSFTFAENDVNAIPAVLDADVTFTDAENNFDGGVLTLSGLLAEDRVGIAGAGGIALAGGVVSFNGTDIGTVAGGAGTTFTVTFNAAATAAAIDALLQNLTYQSASDTPTGTRNLTLEIRDNAPPPFTLLTGTANPFNGLNVGGSPPFSTPTLVDLDNDGDLDLVAGSRGGQFKT